MSMSKKDYETVADVIYRRRRFYLHLLNTGVMDEVDVRRLLASTDMIATQLATEFAKGNSRFDLVRFMHYCRNGADKPRERKPEQINVRGKAMSR